MPVHRLAQSLERLIEIEAPLIRFFTDSAAARMDRDDPETCDFVAGNPQEMALPSFVDALRRWSEPRDPHWFAYKFNEPYAQEAVAAGLRARRGIPFEPEDVFVTDGAFAGLAICIRAVADPGDEVVFCSPPWFFYEALIVGAGATPVRVRVDLETWDLDVGAIEAALTAVSYTHLTLPTTPYV